MSKKVTAWGVLLLTFGYSPTLGTLIDLSPEEVVIKPLPLESKNAIDVRIHFPRLGFVTRPHKTAKL